ncbi:MAG: cobalamin-dependent protein [Bacilli bacterium]|nr:cobalamin-dependent protein [Bacilli bacterium]
MDKKVFLVTLSPKTHRTSEENLGIEYLKSSLVQEGYSVEIIDAWLNELEVEYVYDRLLREEDDILFVGISSYMSNTEPTVRLMQMLKKHNPNIKIACGGFGPTFYPKEYLQAGSDYIMRGEGERAIVELADCISKGIEPVDVKNVGYLKDGELVLNEMRCLESDLDSLPFPSRDTMNVVLGKKSTVNMVTARGCSGNCEFCSVISFFRLSDGKVWRTRSIENIVDEIEYLYRQGVTHIKMVDDSFVDGTRDEKWCKDFADEIERRDIHVRLRGQIRADKVTDGVLSNLKRAGFFSFACGIENGSETALRRMNKKATVDDNRRALELFKKHGYIVQMGYILFDKETTIEELEDNYEFMSEYSFAVTKGIFSEMFSAEGTPLNTRLRNNNELTESDFVHNNNKYTINDPAVARVYEGLKRWHKSHSEIYDMTIDPLTAPKAITPEEMKSFYGYAMELKKQDLIMFRDILLRIKENPELDVFSFVDGAIEETTPVYEEIGGKVKTLYNSSGLNYNAVANPFI